MKNILKKNLKRKIIAKSCSSILEENQFQNISISKLAQTAGIGKGTIYEYFKNKEDIVFELMSCMQDEYDEMLMPKLNELPNIFSKTIALFSLFISDDEKIIKQREIYKQFLIICLSNPSSEIKQYNANIRIKYIKMLEQITSNKSISEKMYDDIVGIFVASNTLHDYDLSSNVKEYIKNQIDLIK